MQVRVLLTGPPRVLLGRAAVNLALPGQACSLRDILAGLAATEPRIARYFQDGVDSQELRPILNDRVLDAAAVIPDGATLTLVYAVAGGTGQGSRKASA